MYKTVISDDLFLSMEKETILLNFKSVVDVF